jgi:hypothetical protein
MKPRELSNFVIEQRCNQKLSWKETAENAYLVHGITTTSGEPYSGGGFQNFVARATGQKKWGSISKRGAGGKTASTAAKPVFTSITATAKRIKDELPAVPNKKVAQLRELLNSNLTDEMKLALIPALK